MKKLQGDACLAFVGRWSDKFAGKKEGAQQQQQQIEFLIINYQCSMVAASLLEETRTQSLSMAHSASKHKRYEERKVVIKSKSSTHSFNLKNKFIKFKSFRIEALHKIK